MILLPHWLTQKFDLANCRCSVLLLVLHFVSVSQQQQFT
uniref:Fork-head domain-containing protein n=1 Tax=Mesocestoides corti TaxID=53468 RepID=A0A5K3FQG4_MESCO